MLCDELNEPRVLTDLLKRFSTWPELEAKEASAVSTVIDAILRYRTLRALEAILIVPGSTP